MNWYISRLIKESRGRRFNVDDRIRYFTEGLKGKGKGIVVTPSFRRGKVVDYDPETKRYRVDNGEDVIDIHPRNLVPESLSPSPPTTPPSISEQSVISEPSAVPEMVEPFPR